MSWTMKIKATRPNTDVDFWTYPVADEDRNQPTIGPARNSNHVISTSLSENELELTKTFVWDDEAHRQKDIEDRLADGYTKARIDYNTANNISIVELINEET